MSPFSYFIALLSLLLSCLTVSSQPGRLTLTFTQQTSRALWPARFAGTVEQLNIPITYNGQVWPAGSFVLHGGQSNSAGSFADAWVSSDKGINWARINTGSSSSSYTPTWMAGYTKDSKGRLYRAGGAKADGTFSNEVWLSENGGVTWTMQTANGEFPGRTFPELMVNSIDEVYIATGLIGNTQSGPGLNDMWQSSDKGKSWFRLAGSLPFPAPPGRSSASLLQHSAPALAYKSVVWYMGGFSRYSNGDHSYHNDVYLSTDYGESWMTITRNAPWEVRDNFNAEITEAGIIVLSSGYNENGPVRRNTLNDVWISMDGGWTWGQCAEDAQFSDRRWQMTLLDNDGYFYIIGGDEGYNNASTNRVEKNDVWRSEFSFNDAATMSRLCNVPVPVCGVGLYCLPGSQTRIVDGRVSCPATEACTSSRMAFNMLTGTAQWSIRHSAGLELTRTRVTVGGTTFPIGSMVLFGGVGLAGTNNDAMLNDTFISTDGSEWTLVSSGYFRGSGFSGHAADSRGRLYKVAGERWGGVDGQYVHGEIFVSTNSGLTWQQQTPTNPTRALPKRGFPDVYVDSKDVVYAVAGLDNVGGTGLNDVWRSTNVGRDWILQGRIQFSAPGGRSSGSLLIHRSPIIGADVMTYIGGYSRYYTDGRWIGGYHNDIYVSKNNGQTWTQLTAAAPFPERGNFNAEVTDDGLIVIIGGLNSREVLNDVWISGDGGYTWGECVAQAQFSDRRWEMTVLDQSGKLVVVGGEEYEQNRWKKQSDVWISSVSLWSSTYSLATACPGVKFSSKCVIGLNCWPKSGSSSPFRPNAAATCYEDQRCQIIYPDDSSTGNDDNGGDNSTGTMSSSDGLSTGAIVLIALLVIAGVGGILGYFYYKRQQSMPIGLMRHGDTLLGTKDEDSLYDSKDAVRL